MIISEINNNNSVYFNLHAEQAMYNTYCRNGLSFSNKGIFCEILSEDVLDLIYNRIIELNMTFKPTIILDFAEIKSCPKNYNFNEKFINNANIVFLNIDKRVAEKFDITINKTFAYVHILSGDLKNDDIKTSKAVFEEKFFEVLNIISIEGDPKEIRNHSSSVYLNKYIDVKRFIVEFKPFIIYSIYYLAMKMRSKMESGCTWEISENNEGIFLLCQNMNTSFIGSILADFLNIDTVIIDHLGPLNKIYKSFGKRLKPNKKYLVLSDVYCLGTENKIAKNLIEFSGGEYMGNVSLIMINTLLEKHRNKDYCSLQNISKENNILNYKIITALEIE